MINNILDFLIALKKFRGKCLKSLKHKTFIFILKVIKGQINFEIIRYENPVKSFTFIVKV